MRRRWLVPGSITLLAAAALLWWRSGESVAPPPVTTAAPAPTRPDSSIPLTALTDPAIPPEKKVRRVYELVQAWSMAMKSRSRIPLSSNAELTGALTGRNPLKVVFLPPDHPSINSAGELVDPWQTPYFFHALAADSWEVASAGPDRIPFNADDIIFPPGRNANSLLGSRTNAP